MRRRLGGDEEEMRSGLLEYDEMRRLEGNEGQRKRRRFGDDEMR